MFKRVLITLFAVFISINIINAQEMVSTEPQTRNVIIEEYTGIHCGNCPLGHKAAQDLIDSLPGQVFSVNIHCGFYATPSEGEPDFRTVVGDSILSKAGVAGYPQASMNRSTTPWAQSVNSMAGTTESIISEISPVNVAVKSVIDLQTRELVTEVEYYYTSDSPESENYLTVYLVQSHILGPQSDYGNYNPDNWTEGFYIHNHVLRMALTDGNLYGDPITTTTKDSYEKRTYRVILPEDIKGVPIELNHCEVVAFVSKGESSIYSGSGAKIEFTQPLEEISVDLEMVDKTEYPTEYCFTTINPVIDVTNTSDKQVSKFDVSVLYKGEEHKMTYEGSLAQGETTTIDWGEIEIIPTGNYKTKIQGFKNINNNELMDIQSINNYVEHVGIGFKQAAFSNHTFGFNEQVLEDNVILDDTKRNQYRVAVFGIALGAKDTYTAVFYHLHSSRNVEGVPGYITMGEVALSQLSSPELSYYYAYSDADYGESAPIVQVEISDNCGDTWENISSIELVETGEPSDPGRVYVPKTTDYKQVKISLEEYADKDVLIRVAGIPGTGGSAMYIDEITIGETTVNVEEETVNYVGISYPNPVEDELFLNTDIIFDKQFEIYSSLGEKVLYGTISGKSIDVSNLPRGIYLVKINNRFFKIIKN